MMEDQLNINSDSRQPALISHADHFTYAEMDKTTARIAARLGQAGVKEGQRVAVRVRLHPDFPLLFFALLRAGALTVPLNPDLPEATAAAMGRQAGCQWLINLDNNPTGLPGMTVIEPKQWRSWNTETETPAIKDIVDLAQPATILFSSGSSGRPRAILHTVGHHYFSALGSNRNLQMVTGDRWLV